MKAILICGTYKRKPKDGNLFYDLAVFITHPEVGPACLIGYIQGSFENSSQVWAKAKADAVKETKDEQMADGAYTVFQFHALPGK